MVQRLFVYGSLAPGRRNAHMLSEMEGTWEEASVRGTLHPRGWGATYGYPAIVLDDGGDEVQGFLFSSDELFDHWERLDQFEGAAYKRVLTAVKLKDRGTVKAYVYALRGEN